MLVYTLAAYRPRRISVTGLVITLLAVAAAIGRWAPAYGCIPAPPPCSAALVGLGGSALIAWVLGDHMAPPYRRAYYASLEDRAEQAEAERDAQARIAAAAERARELQERRARAVDESAARLRRIERDLHDGAQVRLAALALALGEIKENLAPAAAGGVDDDGPRIAPCWSARHTRTPSRRSPNCATSPGAFTRRCSTAASARRSPHSPRPARSRSRSASASPKRPSLAIESIAYFCAAELLANVTKHSGASRATISVSDQGGRILTTVTDDESGGAPLAPGGGLAGLLERAQTVDGHLEVAARPAARPSSRSNCRVTHDSAITCSSPAS